MKTKFLLASTALLGVSALSSAQTLRGSCDEFIGLERERCVQQGGTVEASAKAGSTSTVELVFKTYDKDQDGFISRQEAKASPLERDFAAVDKDRDGRLSLSEYAAARPAAGGESAKPKK